MATLRTDNFVDGANRTAARLSGIDDYRPGNDCVLPPRVLSLFQLPQHRSILDL